MSRMFLAAALTAACLAAPAFAQDIVVHDAYAITSRPGAPTGAAFMVIENHGDTADRLVSASADVAERVELHTHIMGDDGTAQMVHVPEGWEIPAGGQLLLARGSHHVMFMGVTAALEDGFVFPVTLHFEIAGDVVVEVPVDLSRLAGDAATDGMSGHDMSGHDAPAMEGHGSDDAGSADEAQAHSG
ncbi:MAG: copper chaperone PCu(A)C [Rubellimicrobium sp.]|nr:copper chaperone PCu(A)C [Rubellimicrobium sp.]